MFNTMKKVLNKPGYKMPRDEEIEKISEFVFCRWLSGNPITIQAANQLNLYYDIPIKNQFHLVNKAFGGKIRFIPYPKNVKEDDPKILETLAKHFKINTELAKDYLNYISEEELQRIQNLYV